MIIIDTFDKFNRSQNQQLKMLTVRMTYLEKRFNDGMKKRKIHTRLLTKRVSKQSFSQLFMRRNI